MNSFITKKDKLVILNSIFPQTKYGPAYGPYFFSAFSTPNLFYNNFIFLRITTRVDQGSYGVMAITLDFESNNPSSNLGRTLLLQTYAQNLLPVKQITCVHVASFNKVSNIVKVEIFVDWEFVKRNLVNLKCIFSNFSHFKVSQATTDCKMD